MTTTTTDLDEARWQAVSANRARRGDRFFYAVTSTGVFCVPTCTARRPRRENVRFFASAREARDAGFRPCMRCRPDGESETMRLALGAVELIEASRPPTVALDELASTLATSGLAQVQDYRYPQMSSCGQSDNTMTTEREPK